MFFFTLLSNTAPDTKKRSENFIKVRNPIELSRFDCNCRRKLQRFMCN